MDKFDIGLMILLAVAVLIIIGIFALSAAENLGDSRDSTCYQKKLFSKVYYILFMLLFCGYFLYLLINILNGILL